MQPLQLLTALIAGAALGAMFFSGLWWTVRRVPQSKHPMMLCLLSLALRMGIVLAGFYVLLIQWAWPHLVATLAGFMGMRLVLVRFFALTQPRDALSTKPGTVTDGLLDAPSQEAGEEA